MQEVVRNSGMGRRLQILIAPATNAKFGKQIAEGAFKKHADGVPVSVTLNVDSLGRLFELDLFKADGTALDQVPRPCSVS